MEAADLSANDVRDNALPFVDAHTIDIVASSERVWAALQSYVGTSLRLAPGGPLAKILGTEPPAGFEVSASRSIERLTLAGSHRFSRYALAFQIIDASEGVTKLRAETYAEFPGARGRAYRALVIGTHAHVVATRHMLRSIRRLALEPTSV